MVAPWLWERLRIVYPDALAATLMPDHPHIVTPFDDLGVTVQRLNRLLGQLGRRLGIGERIAMS